MCFPPWLPAVREVPRLRMKMESNCNVSVMLTVNHRDMNGAVGHEEAMRKRSIARPFSDVPD